MKRTDFRPNNSSTSISDNDRKLIRTQSNKNITRYNTTNGIAEIYNETINGKKIFFVDVIENNKIKSLPQSDNREQAQGKLEAYNNGVFNEKVTVEGDSSVGIPSYNGIITADYGTHYEVKDNDGNYDEIEKRFVHTEKEKKELEMYYSREILSTEKSRNAKNEVVLGSGKHTYIVKAHSRNDVYGKETQRIHADTKQQILLELSKNGMIADNIAKD